MGGSFLHLLWGGVNLFNRLWLWFLRLLGKGEVCSDDKCLQHAWGNWDVCNRAFFNTNFTPMDALVPERTIFLAGGQDLLSCSKSTPLERNGSISRGTNTIFFPIANAKFADYEDDFEAKVNPKCPNTTEQAEQIRTDLFVFYRDIFKNQTFISALYATMDGNAMTQIYIEDTSKFYMKSCPNGALIGPDPCDVPQLEDAGGVDNFPSLGYYAKDTRYWSSGEQHVFEFGVNGEFPFNCIFTKYTLTAD
jgi:hypothetical protein